MLEGKEKELTTAAQKLQKTPLSAAAAADRTIKQLNGAVQHFDYKCQTKGTNSATVQQH